MEKKIECEHNWKFVSTEKIIKTFDAIVVVVLVCERCGEIKTKEIYY